MKPTFQLYFFLFCRTQTQEEIAFICVFFSPIKPHRNRQQRRPRATKPQGSGGPLPPERVCDKQEPDPRRSMGGPRALSGSRGERPGRCEGLAKRGSSADQVRTAARAPRGAPPAGTGLSKDATQFGKSATAPQKGGGEEDADVRRPRDVSGRSNNGLWSVAFLRSPRRRRRRKVPLFAKGCKMPLIAFEKCPRVRFSPEHRLANRHQALADLAVSFIEMLILSQ